LKVGKYVC